MTKVRSLLRSKFERGVYNKTRRDIKRTVKGSYSRKIAFKALRKASGRK